MSIKDALLMWADQFENDHYEYDVYGEKVTVDLPREMVERVAEISQILVDRVVEAQGELSTAEYIKLEERLKKKYKDESEWLFHVMLDAVSDDRLFGRYKDIEAMIAELKPRGYPTDSAAYYLMAHFDIYKLIYAVIRHVDDVEENYDSLAYTFFLGILAKCWGEGYGWSKSEDGSWRWRRTESKDSKEIKDNEP